MGVCLTERLVFHQFFLVHARSEVKSSTVSVIATFDASTLRLAQSTTAVRHTKPLAIRVVSQPKSDCFFQ